MILLIFLVMSQEKVALSAKPTSLKFVGINRTHTEVNFNLEVDKTNLLFMKILKVSEKTKKPETIGELDRTPLYGEKFKIVSTLPCSTEDGLFVKYRTLKGNSYHTGRHGKLRGAAFFRLLYFFKKRSKYGYFERLLEGERKTGPIETS